MKRALKCIAISLGLVRSVLPAAGDWATYHGQLTGNRYSLLGQINQSNISKLAPAWSFPINTTAGPLETTPIVINGKMFVTDINAVYALDPSTGKLIWSYTRPRSTGLTLGYDHNRGVGVTNNSVIGVSDNAHLFALNQADGSLLWDVAIADPALNYRTTSAPLVIGNLVITGTAGGDSGARGLIAAYNATTGQLAWRFWTIPAPTDPLANTWLGTALPHGGGAPWMTGTYDPVNQILYWGTGNPSPAYDNSQRAGDNLYASSILAINPATGKLIWYYQFTPGDVWELDGTEPPVLIDTNWQGSPRHLLVTANRNGFFYVFDRITGQLLQSTSFLYHLTWASGIDGNGRPIQNANVIPTASGVVVCPGCSGATNWQSTAFNPNTGLFYVQATEGCALYTSAPATWTQGQEYVNGNCQRTDQPVSFKSVRAISLQTGKVVWNNVESGFSYGGILSTVGGLVFYADDAGPFRAVDASTGNQLWTFPAAQAWAASPMTYMSNGKQYIAIAGTYQIMTFSLPTGAAPSVTKIPKLKSAGALTLR